MIFLKKKTDKGEFYFYNKPSKKINTRDILSKNINSILDKISWKKSMKWGNFNLYWGRPLKSILAIYQGKTLNFDYHHLKSSNSTFVDKEFEEKKKYLIHFNHIFLTLKSMELLLIIIIEKILLKKN